MNIYLREVIDITGFFKINVIKGYSLKLIDIL